MKKAALISALVPVLLSACAAGPDYQRPTVDTPAAFKELGDWKPAEPREPAADRWWTAFGDPVLDDLQARLEVSNQNLRAAEAAYRQALALADAARASWFPAINATAGATRSATSAATDAAGSAPPRNSFNLGATASWEADVWGRIARNVEAADMRATASEAVVGFVGRAERIARVHHFGLRDKVKPGGPDYTYPARQLLGITDAQIERVRELLLKHLSL